MLWLLLQITGANLDKKRIEMKVSPYFKAYGDHEEGCEVQKEIINNNRASNSNKGSHLNIDSHLVTLFFERPENHEQIRKVKA